ncbi:lysosome-associated membrane glycoprotein 5 [Alosa alosa]|uniref:lysosome-associated membrane glycoprotein 5 n=1 Tax=Alosa alosa TaxID=278164 RepID=UPI0020153C9B|nr:lysosome-associated membrane glycoprotein 5 [Alosa alosa]
MLKLSDKVGGRSGTTILLEAMSQDKVHLAKFVLDALDGKIVDSKTEGAQTPLISSVFLPDSPVRSKFIKLLLQRGASVNHKDESGRTALSHACEKGYLDAVKVLVQHNADPEMEDLWGNTALMYAVVAGHTVVVEFLVRAFKRLGLQIDRQNKVGNSALKVAEYLGHKECLYALTNPSKKVSEYILGLPDRVGNASVLEDVDTHEVAPQRKTPDLPAHKLSVCAKHESATREASCRSKTALSKRRSFILKNRLQSMDSIEEYEKESEGSPTSQQGLFFSGVLTPITHQKSRTPQFLKQGEKSSSADDPGYLPPLPRGTVSQPPAQFSPRPFKSVPKSSTPATSSSCFVTSPLGILMTPITGNVAHDNADKEKAKKSTFDFGIRRFDDSYYQKRCSLPTSLLSPLPPERAQMPVRKVKAVRKNPPSQGYTEPAEVQSPPASTTFSVLGNKLLRRFTFPEFKKTGKELQDSECPAQSGTGQPMARGMPRSETFPLCTNHPQVGSKPSIDSISAVKCEFECLLFRNPSYKRDSSLLSGARAFPSSISTSSFRDFFPTPPSVFSQRKSTRLTMELRSFSTMDTARLVLYLLGTVTRLVVMAEQESENLSGLSNNPDKDIFAVRENGTTCLMAEFAGRFMIPYDVLALNGIDLITETASVTLPRGAGVEGRCGPNEAELHIFWANNAYIFRLFFVKETRHTKDPNQKESEIWKINKVQLVYDTSETTHFISAYNPGKHTANSHKLSAFVTPGGRSYVCTAQQTLTLLSTDHQKGVTIALSDIHIQPFDIQNDFMFSDSYKCITDQHEQLEETLPLVLGLVLGLIIVITLAIYHFHLKLTAQEPQLPRDRSLYKNM